jgi:hypothetical protein
MMGQYTPAVIAHDLAPTVLPDWVRPLSQASSPDHQRLVVCDHVPRELVAGSHVDLELWQFARRMALADVSFRKLATLSGVGERAVKKVVDALRMERDVYGRRRGVR